MNMFATRRYVHPSDHTTLLTRNRCSKCMNLRHPFILIASLALAKPNLDFTGEKSFEVSHARENIISYRSLGPHPTCTSHLPAEIPFHKSRMRRGRVYGQMTENGIGIFLPEVALEIVSVLILPHHCYTYLGWMQPHCHHVSSSLLNAKAQLS